MFEVVVDSAFVGTRKPEPEIYAIMLERLCLPADGCAFIDDVAHNVDAARDAGMRGIVLPRHARRRSPSWRRCCERATRLARAS